MSRKFISKGIFGIVLAAILISGIAVIPALAQESSGDSDNPTPQQRAEEYLGKVAGKLGISTDALKTACTDAQLEMIDEAVANGVITQEQADEIKARIAENGGACFGFGMPFMGRGPAGPGGFMKGPGQPGLLEDAVGNGLITQEQADQINALGEQIREQFRERIQDREPGCLGPLEDAVENGLITQEQADQINELGQQVRDQLRERIGQGSDMMRRLGDRMRGGFGIGCLN